VKSSLHSLFTFSKKERRAILLLIALIFIARSVPIWINKIWPSVFPKVYAEKIEELIEKEKNRSAQKLFTKKYAAPDLHHTRRDLHPFPFDPNTLDEKGWLRLGVDSSAAQSIIKYLNKGGRFRHPDDLLKMYRLDTFSASRLIPFVRLPEAVSVTKNISASRRILNIEINTADSMQWMSLPGIGPVLSGRILSFRKKLGGFVSAMQLKEVYGMKDSVFLNILPLLKVDTSLVLSIHINTAGLNALAAHPYIKYPAARAIMAYRNAHGPFRSLQDLVQILSLPPGWLEKAAPYLTL
jgi:hypothetical protein